MTVVKRSNLAPRDLTSLSKALPSAKVPNFMASHVHNQYIDINQTNMFLLFLYKKAYVTCSPQKFIPHQSSEFCKKDNILLTTSNFTTFDMNNMNFLPINFKFYWVITNYIIHQPNIASKTYLFPQSMLAFHMNPASHW